MSAVGQVRHLVLVGTGWPAGDDDRPGRRGRGDRPDDDWFTTPARGVAAVAVRDPRPPAPVSGGGGDRRVWTVPDADVREVPRLADVVARLLDTLGATEDAVAWTLVAAVPSVRGWPGHPDMDPVCRWLRARDDRLQVSLIGDMVHAAGHVGAHPEIAVVPLPAPVVAFRQACTAGGHTDMWLPYRAPDTEDVVEGQGTATWAAVPGTVTPAGAGSPPASPQAAAAAAPDRHRPGGGRGLAHAPYLDAVVHALDLRGVTVTARVVLPAAGYDTRSATLELDPDVCVRCWPQHTQVLLRWSERAGWRLLPMRGARVDTVQALGWWDPRRPVGVPASVPDPDRLAAWVAAVTAGATPEQLPGTVRLHGRPDPSGRAAVPAEVDPGFETALDAYRTHVGHRIAERTEPDRAHPDQASREQEQS